MEGRSQDRRGSERRARGVSLLQQAKTAAVLKLQCSATVPQGCVFMFVSAYICVQRAGIVGQYRAEMEREGGREGVRAGTDLMVFAR